MSTDPTYRVYTPGELQSIAPTTFRGAPPPPSRGFFAVGFVLAVCLVIGGGSFAALRFLKVDLANNGRTSLTGGSETAAGEPAVPAAAPAAAPPAASPTAPAPVAAKAPAAPASAASKIIIRRKVRGIRHTGAPAAAAAPGAPELPPNPFETDDRGSLSTLKAQTSGMAP